ncbi:hypothetical protein [Rhodopseudomonas sp. P2A-2r]|uniref:hypothetical protein n=1 Tax=unclassified Rhodopseudomonas TaxID=2638247 RepID=UPI00223472E6|nr:hypothetical protein [Rhodopseudomonas sp. P2A-2r]UZE51272.1 hypothetical protein ONR75_12050 [Rhodopseudomonas sp. P2A-2r]
MADEAFALSPISARASLPSEADYDAIREAFMETSRGRWFLAEYTKRNRNADTGMVLEAVTRLEANLAAQKQAPTIVGLIASLGAIRSAIRDAKVTAAEAMPRFDDDETLSAARNGARIIREIAWTLRECGADVRICDLLDTQVQAIDAGQQRTATADSRAAVLASFDVLVQRIEQLATGDAPRAAAPAATAPAAVPPEQPAASAEKHAASVTPLFRHAAEAPADFAAPELGKAAAQPEVAALTDATSPAEAVASEAMISEAVTSVEYDQPADVAEAMVESPASMAQAVDVNSPTLADIAFAIDEDIATSEVAEVAQHDAQEIADDRAVLDIVALEMAAPDLSEPEMVLSETIVPEMEAPQRAQPDMTAAVAPVAEAIAAPQPEPEAPSQPSLGAALIAGGVIPHPNTPANDPLTPIRRMSQAEKIAFFS